MSGAQSKIRASVRIERARSRIAIWRADRSLRFRLRLCFAVLISPAVCQTLQVGYALWNATEENAVVTAQCLDDTHAFGNLQRRCLPTGQWTSPTGVCNRTQLGEGCVLRYFYLHLPTRLASLPS